MTIYRAGERPSRAAPAAYFTGAVVQDEIITSPAPARARLLRVTFPAEARTAWHTHPFGQTLHVVAGLCLLQERDKPAEVLRPGDTAWIAPGVEHWHGAAPATLMVHLAMQEANEAGETATWLEQVSAADYRAAADGAGL